MRRAITFAAATVATAVFGVFGAGPALAHECFVASRSTQGDASVAAHSSAWELVTLDTILTEFIGLPQPLADCVEANADQFGIPDSFVFGGKQSHKSGVIAESNPNEALLADGNGIDHAEDVYGESIGAAIGFCSA